MWRLLWSKEGRLLLKQTVSAIGGLMDRDGDGEISVDEWKYAMEAPKRFVKWFRKIT